MIVKPCWIKTDVGAKLTLLNIELVKGYHMLYSFFLSFKIKLAFKADKVFGKTVRTQGRQVRSCDFVITLFTFDILVFFK